MKGYRILFRDGEFYPQSKIVTERNGVIIYWDNILCVKDGILKDAHFDTLEEAKEFIDKDNIREFNKRTIRNYTIFSYTPTNLEPEV